MSSLSDQALQMENLIRTLLPFKVEEHQRLQKNKALDLEQSTQWWDRMIENVNEEIKILQEHAAALGIEAPKAQTSTTLYEDGEKLDPPRQETIAAGWPGGPLYVPKEEDER